MKYSNITKYLLAFILVTNSSYSLAFIKDCHKNINFINSNETTLDFNQSDHMCHETSIKHNIDENNENDCIKCKFCSIGNQPILRNNLEIQFTKLSLQQNFQINKILNSFYLKSKGPPPKKLS